MIVNAVTQIIAQAENHWLHFRVHLKNLSIMKNGKRALSWIYKEGQKLLACRDSGKGTFKKTLVNIYVTTPYSHTRLGMISKRLTFNPV